MGRSGVGKIPRDLGREEGQGKGKGLGLDTVVLHSSVTTKKVSGRGTWVKDV